MINPDKLKLIKNLRQSKRNINDLIKGILQQNITCLSQAITIIESQNKDDFEDANLLIKSCLQHKKTSIRVGITGIPGVGKSTFIETFGIYLLNQNRKVAVLAIDPSSSISRGSILGDKTRMETLSKTPNAFIRPSATGETLGGVARKTRETIILCEAAGFDTILIETVGVGQSEIAVSSMVDFFLLLQISGAGDGLQGIKRGIMEMADLIIINKADGENLIKAKQAKIEYNKALHHFPEKKSGWIPKAEICSALNNVGVDLVWNNILKYLQLTKENNFFEINRKKQNEYLFFETINESLKSHFYDQETIKSDIESALIYIKNNQESPYIVAQNLLQKYFKTLINP